MRRHEPAASTIDCSVVVPTNRRHETLAQTLRALVRQTYDERRYEIIVVDDAASDETRSRVKRVARVAPVAIRYVPVIARHGEAATRNVGWRLAHGDVIAFTDDESEPHAGWLAAIMDAASRGADAGWGVTIVPTADPPTDRERYAKRIEHDGFVAANAFCRRAVLDDLGGFDERYLGRWRYDRDLFFRLLEEDVATEHVPEAVVVRRVRPRSWAAPLRDARAHEWDGLLKRDHPALYRRHATRNAASLGGLVLGAIAMGAYGLATRRRRLASVGFGVWAASIGASVATRLRHTSRTSHDIAGAVATATLVPPLAFFLARPR